jgi:hypothetical protein
MSAQHRPAPGWGWGRSPRPGGRSGAGRDAGATARLVSTLRETGRRLTGAFGLIPVGVRSSRIVQASSLATVTGPHP